MNPENQSAPRTSDGPELNGILTTIRTIWAECLDCPPSSLDDTVDFFTLGGSSIQAMVMMLRLGEALGQDIPVEAIVNHRTIADLAAFLSELDPSQSVQEGWL